MHIFIWRVLFFSKKKVFWNNFFSSYKRYNNLHPTLIVGLVGPVDRAPARRARRPCGFCTGVSCSHRETWHKTLIRQRVIYDKYISHPLRVFFLFPVLFVRLCVLATRFPRSQLYDRRCRRLSPGPMLCTRVPTNIMYARRFNIFFPTIEIAILYMYFVFSVTQNDTVSIC